MIHKITLGTVQFGLNYGISNTRGKISTGEAEQILKKASELGVDTLDTAYAYGNSESVLGDIICNSNLSFRIISKLPAIANDINRIFQISLDRLKVENLYGYLFHSYQTYNEKPALWDALIELRLKGKIQKIGFSLYYPLELDTILNQNIDLNIVQIPYSLFDQRFVPLFPELKKRNIEVHIRSVFLQGLVFKNPADLSPHFMKIKSKLETLNKYSLDLNLPVSAICLGFALLNPNIDQVVMGIESLENLFENIEDVKYVPKVRQIYESLKSLKEDDETIILPMNWK